jgi:hypothetical protein
MYNSRVARVGTNVLEHNKRSICVRVSPSPPIREDPPGLDFYGVVLGRSACVAVSAMFHFRAGSIF